MTPIVPATTSSDSRGGEGERQARGRHQRRADDQHPPSADAIGARRQVQRDERVADERRREQDPDLGLVEPDAHEIEDEDDRQRAVGEESDESRGEEQPGIPIQYAKDGEQRPIMDAARDRRRS